MLEHKLQCLCFLFFFGFDLALPYLGTPFACIHVGKIPPTSTHSVSINEHSIDKYNWVVFGVGGLVNTHQISFSQEMLGAIRSPPDCITSFSFLSQPLRASSIIPSAQVDNGTLKRTGRDSST